MDRNIQKERNRFRIGEMIDGNWEICLLRCYSQMADNNNNKKMLLTWINTPHAMRNHSYTLRRTRRFHGYITRRLFTWQPCTFICMDPASTLLFFLSVSILSTTAIVVWYIPNSNTILASFTPVPSFANMHQLKQRQLWCEWCGTNITWHMIYRTPKLERESSIWVWAAGRFSLG